MNTRILTNPSYDTGLLCVICAHACGLHSRCCKPISVCLVCVVARDYGWVSVCIFTMIEWSCPTFGGEQRPFVVEGQDAPDAAKRVAAVAFHTRYKTPSPEEVFVELNSYTNHSVEAVDIYR